MVRLTKTEVERAMSPVKGQTFIRDTGIEGFALRITAKGAKSFVYEGRIRGRARRITLGRYPALSVHQARAMAQDVKGKIARGEDPAAERAERHREPTFGDLADAYLERHAKLHKRSWAEDQRILARYLKSWRQRRAAEITPIEIANRHHRLARESGRYQANRALALVRSIFNKASNWQIWQQPNPTKGIRMFREEKRDRFLSREELRRVQAAITAEEDPRWRAYFPLSLLLGPRKSELLSARWADFDLKQGVWRIPATKSDRPHTLPLSRPAVKILEQLRHANRATSEFVFPGHGVTGHLVEPKAAWARIKRRAGLQNVRLHDLRRTLASVMVARGYGLPLIGKTLNHTNPATTAVYARLDVNQVRAALDDIAPLLLEEDASQVTAA